jgi:hypothetical protein
LLWEYATVIAGFLQGINPFDQPNVESAKIAARALLDSPASSTQVDFVDGDIAVKSFGFELAGSTLDSAVEQLLSLVGDASYISVHAYLNRMAYPEYTLTTFPKELVLDINDHISELSEHQLHDRIVKLLEYTKTNLTTESLFNYIIK